MPAAVVFDIDTLIKPISEEAPCGIDLRHSSDPNSLYYRIKDARQAARAAERANMFDPGESGNLLNNWKPVAELAPKILSEQSKDIEIASWYLEALIRLYGFKGFADGLELINKLIQNCWDGIYPLPDEDGLETTVNALAGLNGISGEGSLIAPIRNAPITPASDLGEFNFWQYQQARDAEKTSDQDKKEAKIASLGYSLSDIEQVITQSDDAFFVELLEYLNRSVNTYSDINKQLREKCGNLAPPSSHIQSTLEEILRTFRHLAKDKLIASQAHKTENQQDQVETTEHQSHSAKMDDQAHHTTASLANRAEAFRKMQEACDYFRLHEPHTPLVSALERLIRWGHMPLHELMAELMPDPAARAFYMQLTGAPIGDDAASMNTVSMTTASMTNYTNTANTPVASPTTAQAANQSTTDNNTESVAEGGDELKW